MLNPAKKRIGLTIVLAFLQCLAWAQDSVAVTGNSLEDTMRSHDKIYVVMSVCVVILLVMILYLVRIDSKISKKEKYTGK